MARRAGYRKHVGQTLLKARLRGNKIDWDRLGIPDSPHGRGLGGEKKQ